jgi:hypothetical protein
MEISKEFKDKIRVIIQSSLEEYGFYDEPLPSDATIYNVIQTITVAFPQLLENLLESQMKFSLINVGESLDDGIVCGNWIHNVHGSLDDAIMVAIKTERLNSNKIDIAVVSEIQSTTPMLSYWRNLKRLDERRQQPWKVVTILDSARKD